MHSHWEEHLFLLFGTTVPAELQISLSKTNGLRFVFKGLPGTLRFYRKGKQW
jgi:hypothetical protein